MLYVPSHTARSLYRDLAAAGVPKTTPKGRLDFHAARVAFINFLIENGDVTPKELQELARHSSIDMSWNVYGRANEERARDAVENLSAIMEIEAESVPFVHRLAVGAERENATPLCNRRLRFYGTGSGARNRTPFPCFAQRRRIPAERREVKAVQRVGEIA